MNIPNISHIANPFPSLFLLRVLNFYFQKILRSTGLIFKKFKFLKNSENHRSDFLLSCSPSFPSPPRPGRWQSEWKFNINWNSVNIAGFYFVGSGVWHFRYLFIDLFSLRLSKFVQRENIERDFVQQQSPVIKVGGFSSSEHWSKQRWFPAKSKYFFTMFNLPPSPFITLSLLTQPFIKFFTILSLHHIIYYWSYLYEVPNFAPQSGYKSSQHALLPFLSRSLGGWGTCVNLGAGVRDQGVREEEGNEAENGNKCKEEYLSSSASIWTYTYKYKFKCKDRYLVP